MVIARVAVTAANLSPVTEGDEQLWRRSSFTVADLGELLAEILDLILNSLYGSGEAIFSARG